MMHRLLSASGTEAYHHCFSKKQIQEYLQIGSGFYVVHGTWIRQEPPKVFLNMGRISGLTVTFLYAVFFGKYMMDPIGLAS
jgi:hypothetical protein